MRRTLFALASTAILLMGLPAFADNPTSLLNRTELATVQQNQAQVQPVQAPILITPAPMPPTPMQGVATQQFGPNYRSYVPLEIKSDNPDVLRTWDPSAHPGNASHLTPEGMACATDADCAPPTGCFNRADSGIVPRRICAVPPGN